MNDQQTDLDESGRNGDDYGADDVDYPVDDLVSEFVDTVNECESVDTSEDLSSVIEMLRDSYDLEDIGLDDEEPG